MSVYQGLVPGQYYQQASFREQLHGVVNPGGSESQEAQYSTETFWKESTSSSLSVLVNPKDPHAMQLWQLRDEHSEQGNGVEHKMDPVVFGVEAGEDVPECVGQTKGKIASQLNDVVYGLMSQ